jgi:hypothetical protein
MTGVLPANAKAAGRLGFLKQKIFVRLRYQIIKLACLNRTDLETKPFMK